MRRRSRLRGRDNNFQAKWCSVSLACMLAGIALVVFAPLPAQAAGAVFVGLGFFGVIAPYAEELDRTTLGLPASEDRSDVAG